MTDRQKAFVEAAVQIAADQGMSRLTIRNVAAAVGVTEPAVYRHFPSKLSLMEAVLQELQHAIRPKFALLQKQELSLEQRFTGFISGLFAELEEKPEFALFLFSEEVFHTEPKLKNTLQQMMQDNLTAFADTFQSLQQEGVCRTDVHSRELAVMFMGTLRLTISQWCWYQREHSGALLDYAGNLAEAYARLLNRD